MRVHGDEDTRCTAWDHGARLPLASQAAGRLDWTTQLPMRGVAVSDHERTILAFDEAGNEYFIDVFVSVRDLSDLQHAGAAGGGLPAFRTREGHAVTHLGGGEFAVTVPGEEETLTVRTQDSDFV